MTESIACIINVHNLSISSVVRHRSVWTGIDIRLDVVK